MKVFYGYVVFYPDHHLDNINSAQINIFSMINKKIMSQWEKQRVLNQGHALLSHTALHCIGPCGYYCPPILVMLSAAEYLYDMYPLKIDQDIMTTRLLWYLQPD